MQFKGPRFSRGPSSSREIPRKPQIVFTQSHRADELSPLNVFVPYGDAAPSTRTRVSSWLDKSGIACNVHAYAGTANHQPRELIRSLPRVLRAERDLRRVLRARLSRTFVHREVSPFSGGKLEARLARASQFFVYDFDDALMYMPKRGAHRFWSKAESCESAVRNADRVIAGSEFLADWASTRNADVRLIPTCVDPGDYVKKSDYDLGADINLVWIGSPSTETYLSRLARPLESINRHFRVRLVVISSGHASLGPVERFATRLQWYPGIESRLSEFDIGVAPLEDGPHERGKCAYKLLQYAAAGLPVMASPVGANKTVIERLGLHAAIDDSSWLSGLHDVIGASQSDRARAGAGARTRVRESYSYEAWLTEWLAAVGEATGGYEEGSHIE